MMEVWQEYMMDVWQEYNDKNGWVLLWTRIGDGSVTRIDDGSVTRIYDGCVMLWTRLEWQATCAVQLLKRKGSVSTPHNTLTLLLILIPASLFAVVNVQLESACFLMLSSLTSSVLHTTDKINVSCFTVYSSPLNHVGSGFAATFVTLPFTHTLGSCRLPQQQWPFM